MDTKNLVSSRTIQGLLVLVLVPVLARFKVALPDAALNDIVGLAITVVAALYSAYGYVAASGRPATALKLWGLLIQYAPQVQKIAAEISVPDATTKLVDEQGQPVNVPAGDAAVDLADPKTIQAAASTSVPGFDKPGAGFVRVDLLAGLVAALALALCLAGCAGKGVTTDQDFATASYKTLSTAGITYSAAMQTAGTLYTKGQITEAQKAQIILYGNAFRGAYQLAQAALEEYVKLGSADATLQAQAVQALADMAVRLSELQTYAAAIMAPATEGK